MEVSADLLLQALPLIGSGITALVVFIKKGVTKDIDVSELKADIKEVKDKVNTMLTDIAVLKVKVDNKN